MRLTFPIRTLGGTVQPEPTDNPVTVPPTLQPVTRFPSPLSSILTAGVATIFSDSFLLSHEKQQIAAQPGYTAALCKFAAGLWHLDVLFKVQADADLAPIIGTEHGLMMSDPLAIIVAFLIPMPTMTVPVVVRREFTVNFAKDGYALSLQGPATAAGQTYDAIVSIIGSRLG